MVNIKDMENWVNNNYSECFNKQVYKELVAWFSKNCKLETPLKESEKLLPGIRIITISGCDSEVKNKLTKIIEESDNIEVSGNIILENIKNSFKGTLTYFGEGLDITSLLEFTNMGIIVETVAFLSSKEKSEELLKHIKYNSQNIRTYIVNTEEVNIPDQLDILKSIINGDI